MGRLGKGSRAAHGDGPVSHRWWGTAGLGTTRVEGETSSLGGHGAAQGEWASTALQVDTLFCVCVCVSRRRVAMQAVLSLSVPPLLRNPPCRPGLWPAPQPPVCPLLWRRPALGEHARVRHSGVVLLPAAERSLVPITWSWSATVAATCAWLTCRGQRQAFSCPRLVVKRATPDLVASCRLVFAPHSVFFHLPSSFLPQLRSGCLHDFEAPGGRRVGGVASRASDRRSARRRGRRPARAARQPPRCAARCACFARRACCTRHGAPPGAGAWAAARAAAWAACTAWAA